MVILVKILATIWVLAVSWLTFVVVAGKHIRWKRYAQWVRKLTPICTVIVCMGAVMIAIFILWLIP